MIHIAFVKARKSEQIERRLRLWLADCAARVLHLFESHSPDDLRPRRAIQAARDYADGAINNAARDDAATAAKAAIAEMEGLSRLDSRYAAQSAANVAGAEDVGRLASSERSVRRAAKDAIKASVYEAVWEAAWETAEAVTGRTAGAAAWDVAYEAAKGVGDAQAQAEANENQWQLLRFFDGLSEIYPQPVKLDQQA